MDFGLFFLMQRDEQWSERAVYDSGLEQMLAAEALGYSSVWIAEPLRPRGPHAEHEQGERAEDSGAHASILARSGVLLTWPSGLRHSPGHSQPV